MIPGFKLIDAGPDDNALIAQHAIYDLKQSSCEFYLLLKSVLVDLGFVICNVDHAVFCTCFAEPPDPSIPMPEDGEDFLIIMPVHINDGFVAINSLPLSHWVLAHMNEHIEVIDQGPVSLYLGIWFTCDLLMKTLWLSQ